jgi:salicylate hydroxylase
MTKPQVAVIGAGMGGLTCALALARAGVPVKVYEQAPQLGEVGAGLTLSPNATRVMNHLGLGDALKDIAVVPPRQWTQHWQSGEVLREFERGDGMEQRYGAAYLHVHRADLHALLADALQAAAPGAIALSHKLKDVSDTGQATFENGTSVQADVIIGADGVRSIVRDRLFDTTPPQFTGQVAWRAIVPWGDLPEDVRDMPPGIHIGPKRLLNRYPVRRWTLLNYVAFVELSGWQEESWSIRSTVDELLGHWDGAHASVVGIIRATPPGNLFKWALHARDPLETWRAGKVTLLGDAAHGMLPFMGQGAASAIEDGLVLARCLAAYSPDEALVRYEAVRRDYTTETQLQSRLLGMQFQGKDPESFGKGAIKNEETLGLFHYDAATVAI